MSFVWPKLLALTVLFGAAAVVVYLALRRRQLRRSADLARYGFTPTRTVGARKHVPYVLFLVGLLIAVAAIARPQTSVSLPVRQGTVILAIDTSNSMRADDLAPTRMQAAKNAATAFAAKQPSTIRIGVVSFGDGAVIVQQPTSDRAAVAQAIKRLKPNGGTSLGQGLFTSLRAITGKPIVGAESSGASGAPSSTGAPSGSGPPATEPTLSAENVQIGYYRSAAIVLLSDGQNQSNLDPIEVAKIASVAGVKVHTVGIGTVDGAVVDVGGLKVATALDEEPLRQIASKTNGTYSPADSAAVLSKVVSSLKLEVKREPQHTEVTGLFAAAALLPILVGAALSMRWFGRMV